MARRRSAIPKPLRSLIGGAVLVMSVRTIDAVWRRTTGRPTPLDVPQDADVDASDPGIVRDRLLYVLLLRGATRLARRSGLPRTDPESTDPSTRGPNGRSPA